MPLLSQVESKSWKGKSLVLLIYVLLVSGAVTMLYPFLLMLSGSLRSDVDSRERSILPKFWTDDTVLYRKYVDSKYGGNPGPHWGRYVPDLNKLAPPDSMTSLYLQEFLAWREDATAWDLGHSHALLFLPTNSRLYRKWVVAQFDGDIGAFRREIGHPLNDWSQLVPPRTPRTRFPVDQPRYTSWREFSETRPVEDRRVTNPDGDFVSNFLIPRYTPDIEALNARYGTSYQWHDEIMLSDRVPEAHGPARADWEEYVRHHLQLEFIRLDPGLESAFRASLQESAYPTIADYNARYVTAHQSFEEIQLSDRLPDDPMERVDWAAFLTSDTHCPAESIRVDGPRQAFERYVAERRRLRADEPHSVRLPIEEADYHDLMAARAKWRWEFTRRNYVHVLEYIFRHGNGIRNTLIYCLLAIGTAVLINPLAAYALSRYKPPTMYAILLFCMSTMAFPGEVTMIPAFLLLKRFPLWPILAGLAGFLLVFSALARWRPAFPEPVRMVISLCFAVFAGAWLVPALLNQPHVSLLNTFWALVLPGAANGFFIFLLKGFFDSLPSELYESAEMDGAGEWTKFWTITMTLSQPILAVIALNAFVAAYSAFMMALIIIPDPEMWTLMVWIYQLQTTSHLSVLYASLVITAIPTFLVFAFCQNIIIRGIVVPVEK